MALIGCLPIPTIGATVDDWEMRRDLYATQVKEEIQRKHEKEMEILKLKVLGELKELDAPKISIINSSSSTSTTWNKQSANLSN